MYRMEKILAKCLELDLLPASESDVYQLQILMSGIQEQWLQHNQKHVIIESHRFLQCNDEPVSKGFLPPLDFDNDPTLELNVGPQVGEFLPSTSSATLLDIVNSESRGGHLDKNTDIIVSLASPPPPPSPSLVYSTIHTTHTN
ncbi:hypothetical protein OROMI_002955 [Orobanche minor]